MAKKRKRVAKKTAPKAVCKPCSLCGCTTRDWYMWFSGLFALAALVHLVRWLFDFSLVVREWAVPITTSIWVFVIAGIISIVLCRIGLKK